MFKKLERLIKKFDRIDESVREISDFKNKKNFEDIKYLIIKNNPLLKKNKKDVNYIKKYLDI